MNEKRTADKNQPVGRERVAEESAIHQSYWLKRQSLKQEHAALEGTHKTGVLVIGGGITGLSVAFELLQRGHNVTVCESNVIGAGTTGGSSGHLDAHPEGGPKRLIESLGSESAQQFTRMRRDAIDAIRRRAGDHADFAEVPAFYYTEQKDKIDSVREQMDQAIKLGLAVDWTDEIPISRAVAGYRIGGTARIDCLAYLRGLADRFVEVGGTIFERTLITGPTENRPTELASSSGVVQFEHVVSAVHCNFTGSQRLYIQTPAYQSYVLAAEVDRPLADGLFWDNSDPYYYVRRGPGDGHLILVGGCDHRTGDGNEMNALESLEAWTRERFGVTDIVTRWSAELFEPTDGLPFIGKVTGTENVWIATGLSGIGLTLGTAAGPLLADLIEGKPHPLENPFSPARTSLSSAGSVASEQTLALKSYADRVLPASKVDVGSLQPGEGEIGKVDGQHLAVCRDRDGCLHQRSPICTHMGGILRWNHAAQTWDCPVHGGRFTADGARLYGPPESDLERPSQP